MVRIPSTGRPVLPLRPLEFGFLGAYAFITQDLIRRYYRDDLRTSAYIAAIARIIFVSVVITALDVVWSGTAGNEEIAFAFLVGRLFHTAGA